MTANVLPFHGLFNAKQLFVAGCQRLNAAGSETMHTVAEMLGFCFAEVADAMKKVVKCIPVIAGELVAVFFRYMDETIHILDRQLQCAGPCFYQKIEQILPADFELAELEESVSVEQYRQVVVRHSVLPDFPAPDVADCCAVSVSRLLFAQQPFVLDFCPQ